MTYNSTVRCRNFHSSILAALPDGPEGLRKNVDMVCILRETLGEDTDFMLDAWMSWNLSYAIGFAQRAEQPTRVRWA